MFKHLKDKYRVELLVAPDWPPSNHVTWAVCVTDKTLGSWTIYYTTGRRNKAIGLANRMVRCHEEWENKTGQFKMNVRLGKYSKHYKRHRRSKVII